MFFSLLIDTFQNYCFQSLTTLALNMGIADQAEVKAGEQKCEEGVKLGQEAGFISPCFIPAASSGPCFICSAPDSPLCPDCEKVPTNYHFSTFLESHHHHIQCQFDQHYQHYQHYHRHQVKRILLISSLYFTHAIQVKLQNQNSPTKSCLPKETAQLKIIEMQNMPTQPTQVYVCDVHRVTHSPASVCQPFDVSRFIIIIILFIFLLIFKMLQKMFSSNSGSTASVAWSWQVGRSGQERLCFRNKPWSVYRDDVCNVDGDIMMIFIFHNPRWEVHPPPRVQCAWIA